MVQNTTGGTFGCKFSPTMEALIGVAVLATGRPCHLRYNYQQQQQYTGKRSPFWTKVRMAANKKTGKIVVLWRPTGPATTARTPNSATC